MSVEDLANLDDVRVKTRMMRDHQARITTIGQERRELVLGLRERGVTYRRIAEAMDTTEQAVYKVVRGDL